MSDIVLDASVVLAAVLDESGGDAIGRLTGAVLLSAVNYAEVRTRLFDLGFAEDDVDTAISILGMQIVPFDERQARQAADLRVSTRAAGLSLGDRACLALASLCGAIALTADRAWQQADLSVEIRFIR